MQNKIPIYGLKWYNFLQFWPGLSTVTAPNYTTPGVRPPPTNLAIPALHPFIGARHFPIQSHQRPKANGISPESTDTRDGSLFRAEMTKLRVLHSSPALIRRFFEPNRPATPVTAVRRQEESLLLAVHGLTADHAFNCIRTSIAVNGPTQKTREWPGWLQHYATSENEVLFISNIQTAEV